MGYLFYSLSFFVLIVGTVLYLSRSIWLPYLPESFHNRLDDMRPRNWLPDSLRDHLIRYTPLTETNFRDDVESGLHSSDFDMTGNVEGDSRSGLDAEAKREVLRIMKRRGVGFDEARRVYMEQRFRSSGIGADGLPRDPKLVTFS